MEPTRSDPESLEAVLLRLGLKPPKPLTPEEEAERRAAKRAELEAENEREEGRFFDLLAPWGVGERTAAVLRATPATTKALTEVTLWAAGGETFCLLLGGPGSGKTVAAASALRLARLPWNEDGFTRWCYAKGLGLFVAAEQLARSAHGDGDLLKSARAVAVLVIDDLGEEYADAGERWIAELSRLIDRRHEAQLRTVITSNLTAQAFKARYGERVASRIRGAGRVVPCGAVDLRGRASP